ncbi:MAG TPA: hypothetical protein VKA15_18945 [Isosphaeraceae bacterium]|nr:hypothetical protein [Isosphaeraceae bacterium]
MAFNPFDVSTKELVWDDPVALCKEANSPSLTGLYERQAPDGWVTNRYNYRVVRLWKEDPEQYLNAGVALVPLATLADVQEESLPELVQRMAARINAEPPARATKLWTATYLLMGLRYSEELANHVLEGVANMTQSVTYQAILREGRKEGLIEGRNEGRLTGERQILIRLGTKRFGEPDAVTVAAIEAIQDVNRLESLGERILEPDLQGWDALLRTT